MKRLTLGILISLSLLPASFMASAEGLDTRQWDAYCKAQENKERCESANQVCEENEDADCDQIKVAYMQRRPLDSILSKDKSKVKKKANK